MSRTSMAKSKDRRASGSRKSRVLDGNTNPLGGICWKLPSGESLAEFAFRFGFLAPRLLGPAGHRLKQFQRSRRGQ